MDDEEAALADIVNQMANGIIDVNMAHTSQTLEPAELQERAYEYGRQLQNVSAKLAQKYAHLRHSIVSSKIGHGTGLQDANGSASEKLMHSEILNSNDTVLINEVAARAREASSEFKLVPVPTLIGVFGQIRKKQMLYDDEEEHEEDDPEHENASSSVGGGKPEELSDDEDEGVS